MKRLSQEITGFFRSQGFVIVTTIDPDGTPHTACKGIVRISSDGRVYLLDLYLKRTFANLQKRPAISITAVDEHHFAGYCLKGKAMIVPIKQVRPQRAKTWDQKITERITNRILKNLREEPGHASHPEAQLPRPEYLIVMDVNEIVDLSPAHLKKSA